MHDGKKSTAQRVLMDTFDLIKTNGLNKFVLPSAQCTLWLISWSRRRAVSKKAADLAQQDQARAAAAELKAQNANNNAKSPKASVTAPPATNAPTKATATITSNTPAAADDTQVINPRLHRIYR